MPEPELFESERQEMDRLHLQIYRTLHRAPQDRPPPSVTLQPYHAAYVASRIQQLESLVGAMLSLLLTQQTIPQKDLFELLGDIYGTQIQDLELHAVIHNTAYHLAPRLKQDKPDDDI